MENEKIVDGGLLRFNAILAAESFGTPDDLEFQDDADLIHADAIETPVVEAVPTPEPITSPVVAPAPVVSQPAAPLKPGEFYLSPALCIEYGKSPKFVVNFDTFAALILKMPVEEFKVRSEMRQRREESKRRAKLIPAKVRHKKAA
jgi:hypothetical protein